MKCLLILLLCLVLPLQVTAQEFDVTNCYAWAEYRLQTNLPTMLDISLNAEKRTPKKGDVAYFFYEKSGLPHVGIVEYVFDDGSFYLSETNMKFYHPKNGMGVRLIPANYKNLKGFITPILSSSSINS